MAELRFLFIVLFVSSGVALGMVTFYTDLFTGAGVTPPENIAFINKTSETMERANEIGETLQSEDIIKTTLYLPWTIYSVILFFFSIIDTLTVFASESLRLLLFTETHWFLGVIKGVILIIIIFEVLSAIVKRRM